MMALPIYNVNSNLVGFTYFVHLSISRANIITAVCWNKKLDATLFNQAGIVSHN